MKTLLDYVERSGDISLKDKPLNQLDFALFNELGYLQIIEHLPTTWKHKDHFILSDLAPLFHASKQDIKFSFLNSKERIALFEAVLTSKRYQKVTISHYVNDVNAEFERQFAAMVFTFPEENTHQIVFRGTDDSLIGWKEDFKLTYMREISAQRAATVYLREILSSLTGQIVLSGHSKGGNLAVYAAAHLSQRLQQRLALIYMYDAPGFRPSFLKSVGYRRIAHQLLVLRPFESVVGVMLSLDKEAMIVGAKDKGMAQHMMNNWLVDDIGDYFVFVQSPSSLSQKLERTFVIWNDSLSHYELKHLFDLLFDQLLESGVSSLDDLAVLKPFELAKQLDVYRRLTPEQRKLFRKALNLFVQAYRSSSDRNAKADFSKWFSNLTYLKREKE